MAKVAKIKIDDVEYSFSALNLDELQEVSDILAAGDMRNGAFEIVRVCLKRVTPQPDMAVFTPSLDEVGEIVRQVLTLSGLQKPDANPPQLAVVAGTEAVTEQKS